MKILKFPAGNPLKPEPTGGQRPLQSPPPLVGEAPSEADQLRKLIDELETDRRRATRDYLAAPAGSDMEERAGMDMSYLLERLLEKRRELVALTGSGAVAVDASPTSGGGSAYSGQPVNRGTKS